MAKPKQTTSPLADPLPIPSEAPGEGAQVLTVNGQPIPEHLAYAIPYENTDQGIAERNARPNRTPHRVSVRDRFERSLERMEDEDPAYDDMDPFKEAVQEQQAKETGFEYRFLADRVVKRRGRRGFEPIVDGNGDVKKVGDLVMARIPTGIARRRRARNEKLANEALQNAEEQYQAEQEKVIRNGARMGLSTLRSGEVLTDERNPERSAVTGLRTVRGEEGQTA